MTARTKDEATAGRIIDEHAQYIEPKQYYATIEKAIAAALLQARIEELEAALHANRVTTITHRLADLRQEAGK